MTGRVAAIGAKQLGGGFTLSYVDNEAGQAVFSRQVEVASISKQSATQGKVAIKEVTLPPIYQTPSAGEKVAGYFESQEDFKGFTLTRFEPHAGTARFTRLTPNEVTARNAIAEVLGVKPWEVEIKARQGGGFTLTRVPSKYTPSRHGAKLNEAAAQKVPGGRPGWFVRIDGQALTGEILPAKLPTFPDALPYNMADLDTNVNVTPFGMKLPDPGAKVGQVAAVEWLENTSLLVAGLPSSGKRQPLISPIPVPVSDRFPTGWAQMGDLQVGDEVYNRWGSTTRIKSVTRPISRPTWKFTFLDGQTVLSDADHLWLVGNKETLLSPTHSRQVSKHKRDLLERLDTARHIDDHLPSHQVAQALGVGKKEVVKANKTKSENPRVGDIAEVLHRRLAAEIGYNPLRVVSTAEIVDSLDLHWATPMANPVKSRETFPEVISETGALAQGTIEELSPRLLRAQPTTRMRALIQIAKQVARKNEVGEYVFTLHTRPASATVAELARSLGMMARLEKNQVHVLTVHDLHSTNPGRRQERPLRNPIVSATYVGKMAGKCIEVEDPSHTYLTAGFIVTHNTVFLNSLVASQLASKAELVIVDTPEKSADFMWMRQWVREKGWGCESTAAAATALELTYQEGHRRATIIKDSGGKWVNWQEMPPEKRFEPITVIVDEFTALTVKDPVPKALPKDDSRRIEIEEENFAKELVNFYTNKLIKEMRFVGIRVVVSSQVTSQATGMPPAMKNAIAGHFLLGSRPSEVARNQAFSDPRSAPKVPDNVADNPGSARGTGVGELTGQSPFVFKTYYASAEEYRQALADMGLTEPAEIEPSAADIERVVPTLLE